jgi:protein involved in polysaccharide export with SLBB domain
VRASKREVELRDPDGKMRSRVDLAAFYSRGDLDSNPHLEAGQVIFVPVIGREVEIVGEVNAPGYYEARRGEGLGELLQLAGGPSPLADLSQVSVESLDSTGAVSLRTLDLRDNSPPTDGVVRVAVLSSMLGKRRVFAIMPDGTQRTLYLAPQETLRDLVRRTAQVDPDADVSAATLATRDKDGRPEQVLVDLPRVLRGETDAPLQDGDVLSIPSVKSYVYMSGFVGKPGRIPYRADWTVNDYLGEGGGPVTGGSRTRVVLIGTNGRERSGDRRTRVERGDTIHVDRSLGGKVATFLGVFTSFSALVISVVAITRR